MMFKNWFKPFVTQDQEALMSGSALVVSDDAQHATYMCDYLKQKGWDAYYTTNADDTCQLIDQTDMPTVIVCDFVRPEVDAQLVLQKVRFRFGKSAMPPVIFFRDMPNDEQVARKVDASYVLLKPVDPANLWECVNLFMAR